MRLSTEFNYGSILFGSENAIPMLAKIGFDALDYSMFDLNREDNPVNHDDYRERMASFRRIADENGIIFNQTHAPFPCFKPGDEEYNSTTYPQLIRALEATAILGAPFTVMHPQPAGENSFEINRDFFMGLAPYCRQFGVKIAIENIIGTKNYCANAFELAALVDALPDDCFTCLVDIGHASIANIGAGAFMHEMGARVSGLHVHDNDTVHDFHNLPYTKSLDWEEICKALADTDYKGDLTFEAGFFIRQFPKELAVQAYEMMHAVGRQLISTVEKYKNA